MKNLLLTGVPGWLTTALLDSLRTHPLPGLESLTCFTDNRLPLPETPALPGLRTCVTRGRIEDTASLKRAIKSCDSVLHTAGLLHVRRTRDWYDVNTQGTKNLLDAARSSGTVQRFVFVSSNAAVGKAPRRDHLLKEEETPRPLSHYGRSKLLAEEAVRGCRAQFETVVLRPCMFYGPPVPARHVDIYQRILNGRMPMIGHGDYARSLTYIDHLVQACRLALVHPNAAGETFFIADAKAYTTRSIIEAMAVALDPTTRYLRLPAVCAPLAYAAQPRLLPEAPSGPSGQPLRLLPLTST